MNLRFSIFFAFAVTALAAFGAPAASPQSAKPDANVTDEYKAQVKSIYDKFAKPPHANYIAAANQFGLKFFLNGYKKNHDSNLLYSPLALSTHMAMLANLVNDMDRDFIGEVMGWGEEFDLNMVNGTNELLTNYVNMYHRAYTLTTPTQIWNTNLDLPEMAQQRLLKSFGASVESLDLNSPEAVASINNWAKEKTKGLVSTLVTADNLAGLNFFIADGVYFEAKWRHPFYTGGTGKFSAPGGTVNANYMYAKESQMKLLKDDNVYDLVAIPYAFGATTEVFGDHAHGQASMWTIVPKGNHTLDEVVGLLSAQQIMEWGKKIGETQASWFAFSMPKWKFTFQDEDFFNTFWAVVQKEPHAFTTPSRSDILFQKPGQKNVIEVAEEGTKAASIVFSGASPASSIPPYSVTLNRPFVYVIVDKATGAVLFVGTVTNPTVTE